MMRRRIQLAAVCLVLLLPLAFLPGCQTLGYYAQAVNGQLSVWHASQPIDGLLEQESTQPALRQRLLLVTGIRNFASEQLALPDNDSYRNYADVQRPYVVWNVFAAPELSLMPKTWCFPFAGCVAYRGYFSEEAAGRFADTLRKNSLDVYVGGVPAYSTLGWFDDPVLSTFINYPDAELARLIFHELAHQVAYAPDDTMFNESFATAVELEGVRRWLDYTGQEQLFAVFEQSRARYGEFLELVMRTRRELEQIYGSDADEESKRSQKAEAFERLRTSYSQLKVRWGGYSGFDQWFSESLNNAKLGSVAAYNELVPAFQKLLADKGGELGAFYDAVRELASLPEAQRRERLDALRTTVASGDVLAR